MRREWHWTPYQLDKLNKVLEILNELKDYKPLTLRQIYYQLVGKGFIENKVSQYGMLSNLLKWARIDGYINWDDIEDRVRAFHDLRGWNDEYHFIKQELSKFLYGYRRDLLQSQNKYLEIWIEKDALSSLFTRVASPYTIPVVVCRGFSSVSFLHEFTQRLKYQKNKIPIMLYFGDFDPSGVEMLNSMEITLKEELGVPGIIFKRIALLKQDITVYNLPHSPEALKKTDTRAKKHVEEHGEIAVELDALRPDILENKIKTAVETELNIHLFNKEAGVYKKELDLLNQLKSKVVKFIKEVT